MGAETKIQWCDYTFNSWEGCTMVSPGCANCYAEARNARFGGGKAPNWGKGAPRRRTSAGNWSLPVHWNKAAPLFLQCTNGCRFQSTVDGLEGFCPGCGEPQADAVRPRVFCASLADWLDGEVPIEWLADLLALIQATPNLDWLLLTKRPENWRERIKAVGEFIAARRAPGDVARVMMIVSWLDGSPPANVWIGTTVEDQERADKRIPELLKIPAKVRFLSCEPLLGAVELCLEGDCSSWRCPECGSKNVDADVATEDGKAWECPDCKEWEHGEADWKSDIHWVICGGESGPNAREFIVDYADDLRRQCEKAGVAFFMKQLGAKPICSNVNALDWPEATDFFDDITDRFWVAGARIGLNDKKGGDVAEFPTELQVRQFPEARV